MGRLTEADGGRGRLVVVAAGAAGAAGCGGWLAVEAGAEAEASWRAAEMEALDAVERARSAAARAAARAR